MSLEPLVKAVRSTIRGQLNPLPMYAIDTSHVTVGTSFAEKKGDTWRVQIKGEEAIELRLLREHLPKDKLWQRLEKFSESTANWITTRIRFASEIKLKLTQIATSRDVSGTTSVEPFEIAGLSVIDAAAFVARIDGKRGIDELLDSLFFDSRSSDLRVGSIRLLSIEAGDVGKYRTAISNGAKAVMKSGFGRGVLTTKTAFDRTGSDLLDELAVLRLVTYLPGTCSSCKKFRLK